MGTDPTLSEEIRAEVTRHHDEWDDRAEHLAIKGLYGADLEEWSTQAAALEAETVRLRALLAALVAVDPIEQAGSTDAWCRYCGDNDDPWYALPQHVAHKASCPWVLAREALATTPDAREGE